MIEFVQATKEDILSIEPQPLQCEPMAISCGKTLFEQDLVPLDSCAIAVRKDDRCIGAYGIIEMWPGVARCWALLSTDLIVDHTMSFCTRVKRDLDGLEYHRIEATSKSDHEAGARFLEWLGFDLEGLMHKYTMAGEDMYLYAKVRDGVV